ncbi:MAG: UDP-N-acetylmuramate--L-alanine ligase [Candidatus Lumbricidophila eiseniae]|uniref:UDP-N-acetylmuramate--L-alanine ligase n=1 Tax=Candidatus Lumbricidiphila eiseniae TaxID=1969409 RepID=A0A2A6FPS4_9MICO|nr:MAG: UDP-N-acetylmuramate--L-alanine ligase [Candidatus Lumbricidophila eiseniae]
MPIKPDSTVRLPDNPGALHFVGIGGSGMSGIARLFLTAGHRVTGSDIRDSANIAVLRELGADIQIGHDAAHVGAADTMVVTGALWEENPEYQEALRRGIPVLHRSHALAGLVRGLRLVSVAGAHGKTTSTGMIVTGLLGLGVDPTFINGGVIETLRVSARSGTDPLAVIEADESDGSFLFYDTSVALITNVDADHLDHYGTHEVFEQAFVDFADGASELVVVSSDDPGARRIRARTSAPNVVTFGEAPDATVRVHTIETSTDVVPGGAVSFLISYRGSTHHARLRVPGHHNAINAAGAFAVLVGLGYDPAEALAGIEMFGGTHRRFELHATVGGVSVYDDYAHHPTEVIAAVRTARAVAAPGRVIAVHQPHLYSRTRLFAGEFAHVLEQNADHTVVLDVCGAREDPEPGVTGELVVRGFAHPASVAYRPDWQDAADYIAEISRPGDLVITLGCGDVYRLIPQIVAALRQRAPARDVREQHP